MLSPEEVESLTAELGKIVDYVDQLSDLNTDDVEPLDHAVELVNVFANDKMRASLSRDEALSQAPNRDDDSYLVPAVLGE